MFYLLRVRPRLADDSPARVRSPAVRGAPCREASDVAPVEGILDEVGAPLYLKFVHYVGPVMLHRPMADVQEIPISLLDLPSAISFSTSRSLVVSGSAAGSFSLHDGSEPSPAVTPRRGSGIHRCYPGQRS